MNEGWYYSSAYTNVIEDVTATKPTESGYAAQRWCLPQLGEGLNIFMSIQILHLQPLVGCSFYKCMARFHRILSCTRKNVRLPSNKSRLKPETCIFTPPSLPALPTATRHVGTIMLDLFFSQEIGRVADAQHAASFGLDRTSSGNANLFLFSSSAN